MSEEKDKNIKRIQELFETGMSVGMIFTQEIDRVVEEHKDLFKNNIEKTRQNILIKMICSDILSVLMGSGINPYMWSELLMVLSRHSELMLSEGKRITERHNKEEEK